MTIRWCSWLVNLTGCAKVSSFHPCKEQNFDKKTLGAKHVPRVEIMKKPSSFL